MRVWPGTPYMADILGGSGQTTEWLGFVMAGTGLESRKVCPGPVP
jgi:hypothetical protein